MIIVAAASWVGQRIIGGVDLLELFRPSRAFRGACGDAVRVGFQCLSCFLSIHSSWLYHAAVGYCRLLVCISNLLLRSSSGYLKDGILSMLARRISGESEFERPYNNPEVGL